MPESEITEELLIKVEEGDQESISALLKWLELPQSVSVNEDEKNRFTELKTLQIKFQGRDPSFEDFNHRIDYLIQEFYPETYNIESIKKKNEEIYKLYNDYYNKLKDTIKEAKTSLKYVIIYEAPPTQVKNYILHPKSDSQYKKILEEIFKIEEKDPDLANLLISQNCLFIDILPLPIKLKSEQRKNWSLEGKSYILFENTIKKIVNDFNLSKETKIAIGTPPNTSLGIYNKLPLFKDQFINIFKDADCGDIHYKNLVAGNDLLNASADKEKYYDKAKFNSHKSNVSSGQNPDLDLLKYAWQPEK
jgi:hypothetical protein